MDTGDEKPPRQSSEPWRPNMLRFPKITRQTPRASLIEPSIDGAIGTDDMVIGPRASNVDVEAESGRKG